MRPGGKTPVPLPGVLRLQRHPGRFAVPAHFLCRILGRAIRCSRKGFFFILFSVLSEHKTDSCGRCLRLMREMRFIVRKTGQGLCMLKGFSMRKENAPPSPCHLQREECSRQSRCGADRVPAGIRRHSRRNQKGEACDYVFHIVLCNK